MSEIIIYGNSALREKATPVAEITPEIRALAKEMLDVMYANNGVGLAAEQIGRSEAMFVLDVSCPGAEGGDPAAENPHVPMPLVLINPRITDRQGSQSGPEGCLSFPEIFVTIERASDVEVAFTDLEGRSQSVRARGLLARAIQHEYDHLEGVLLVDRMSPVQKVAAAAKLKRLKRQSRR